MLAAEDLFADEGENSDDKREPLASAEKVILPTHAFS